ncbi:MAG TPA: helix-turn-helix domain-containing protein [Chloroflexota bacterium]|nr:helix-turn-helix domain-containing protein [Chloroflexota bacterium]
MTDALLTLRQAAALSGRGKKELLALVEHGRLPAVRREGRWLIPRADLARFASSLAAAAAPSMVPVQGSGAPIAHAGTMLSATGAREETTLLLDALRRRDEQIAQLQEERVRLTGQLGFLQGLLVEREARLRELEALLVVQTSGTGTRPLTVRPTTQQEPTGEDAAAVSAMAALENPATDGRVTVPVTLAELMVPAGAAPEPGQQAPGDPTAASVATTRSRGLLMVFRRFGRHS